MRWTSDASAVVTASGTLAQILDAFSFDPTLQPLVFDASKLTVDKRRPPSEAMIIEVAVDPR
jgi:hypothetical protein